MYFTLLCDAKFKHNMETINSTRFLPWLCSKSCNTVTLRLTDTNEATFKKLVFMRSFDNNFYFPGPFSLEKILLQLRQKISEETSLKLTFE